MKRGQASLESMLTYGWALLVIFGVVLALSYLGVFSPPLPGRCDISQEIRCTDYKITSFGVTVILKNFVGYKIDRISVSVESCGNTSNPSSLDINSAAAYTINCSIQGNRFRGQLNVSYRNVETQIFHDKEGEIADSLE